MQSLFYIYKKSSHSWPLAAVITQTGVNSGFVGTIFSCRCGELVSICSQGTFYVGLTQIIQQCSCSSQWTGQQYGSLMSFFVHWTTKELHGTEREKRRCFKFQLHRFMCVIGLIYVWDLQAFCSLFNFRSLEWASKLYILAITSAVLSYT